MEFSERPILWHIIIHYAHHGLKRFYIALGYKGEAIKCYFLDCDPLEGNITISLPNGQAKFVFDGEETASSCCRM